MERREENQHIIDQYLLGQLSRKDIAAFLDRCAQDEELAQQLADTKQAIQAIEVAGDQQLLNRLQQLERSLSSEDTASMTMTAPAPSPEVAAPSKEAKVVEIRPMRRWLSIAATVLLVIAAGYFLLRPTSFSNQDLFAEAFAPYPNSELLDRGSADERQTAYFAYQSGEYEQAYDLLTALPADPGNSFFAAQAALESGQIEAAIDLLAPLATDRSFVLREEAEWSLALAYLQLDRLDEARPLLMAISRERGHEHQGDATTLLTRIR